MGNNGRGKEKGGKLVGGFTMIPDLLQVVFGQVTEPQALAVE
jgi:hypothetical protein